MPRPKRKGILPEDTSAGSLPLPETTQSPAEQANTRPRRTRKQTQTYQSTPAPSVNNLPKGKGTSRKRKLAAGSQSEVPGNEDDSQPPSKRSRKSNKAEAGSSTSSRTQPEKRRANFKPHCPQNILERAERVRTQRFYMVDRKRNEGELREEFKVLGSTGNVYTVVIDHVPKCSCPDHGIRGNHCKHILFIFLKVLSVPITSPIWYQKALITSELETVFAQAPEAPNAVTNPRVREAFLRATGQLAESSSDATSGKKRIPGEEDDCPICYDTMFGVAETSLTFCNECGNALHKECFKEYENSARKNGKEITCVWCRSEWGVTVTKSSETTAIKHGRFLNLAGAVGIDPRRDTSSYYHGPRRGQPYDYDPY